MWVFLTKGQIWLKCAQNNWSDYRILVGRGSGNGGDTMLIGKTATRWYKFIYDLRISFWDYKCKRQRMTSSCHLLTSCDRAAEKKDTFVTTSSPAMTALHPASYSWLAFLSPDPVRPIWIIPVLLPEVVASYSGKAYQMKVYSGNCIIQ